MNVTPEMMYWLTRCDSIHLLGVFLSIMAPMAFVLFLCIDICCDFKPLIRWLVWIGLSALILLGVLMAVFVPSTKEMAAIYVVPKIANSQTVKDLGEGVVTLAREWLEELRPAKKGGAK